ncbi:MAG: WG repeat-containing protein, partial [Bacteroidales bacterium]|nr:WG repeat-containing protein [Bacteroidales bacterium]
VPPLFDIIWRISDDGFSLVSTGCRTKWGILDKNGKFIVEPKYDFVGFYDSGMAVEKLFAVKIGDNWGYVDKTGKMVIEPQFKEAGRFLGNYAIVAKDEDYSAYNYGIIDTTGTYVVKPIYNNIDIVYRGK